MSWVMPYFFQPGDASYFDVFLSRHLSCVMFLVTLFETPPITFFFLSTHFLFLQFWKLPIYIDICISFGICRLFSSLEHFFFRLNFESSQTIFDAFSSPNFDSHQSYLHWCVLNKILWATLLSLWIIRHSCWTKFLQFVFHLTKYHVAECQWYSFPMFCHWPLSCWQPAHPKTSNCENDWASTNFFGGDNADV